MIGREQRPIRSDKYTPDEVKSQIIDEIEAICKGKLHLTCYTIDKIAYDSIIGKCEEYKEVGND